MAHEPFYTPQCSSSVDKPLFLQVSAFPSFAFESREFIKEPQTNTRKHLISMAQSTSLPRALTDNEWTILEALFPQVSASARQNYEVTAETTGDYNCIAWSLGITDSWINPPPSVKDFQALLYVSTLIPQYVSHRF